MLRQVLYQESNRNFFIRNARQAQYLKTGRKPRFFVRALLSEITKHTLLPSVGELLSYQS